MSLSITPRDQIRTLQPRIYESIALADAENGTTHFVIVVGLDKNLVLQLRKFSLDANDVAVQEHTSDRKRFGEGSYETWYAKDRTPFALVSRDGKELAALVWFGPKPFGQKSMKHQDGNVNAHIPDFSGIDWHTLSYRSYPPFRGTGIMKDFVRFATEAYLSHHSAARLWAILDRNNVQSMGLAGALGFKEVDDTSDDSQVVMAKE